MTRKLLEGVKIADFCWVWVGPMTTKTLGDQGAEVIRIESKTRPGVWRVTPPFKDNVVGFNRGGVFNVINTSKRSVTLNLSHPKGVEVAKRLVAWADVVTENFAGGTMERMGLGYEDLRKVKPDIIMLSAAMMGQTGPHSKMPGFGAHLTAISGFSHIAGWPDREDWRANCFRSFPGVSVFMLKVDMVHMENFPEARPSSVKNHIFLSLSMNPS